jgi:hypothetical protein
VREQSARDLAGKKRGATNYAGEISFGSTTRFPDSVLFLQRLGHFSELPQSNALLLFPCRVFATTCVGYDEVSDPEAVRGSCRP